MLEKDEIAHFALKSSVKVCLGSELLWKSISDSAAVEKSPIFCTDQPHLAAKIPFHLGSTVSRTHVKYFKIHLITWLNKPR